MVYTFFEGIVFFFDFPLSSFQTYMEISLKNFLLFSAFGLAFYLLSFLFHAGRLKAYRPNLEPLLISVLIIIPIYFFLFDLIEGNLSIPRYFNSPQLFAVFLILALIPLFVFLSWRMAKNFNGTYPGFVVSFFFFITIGRLCIEWGALFRFEFARCKSFLFILIISVGIHFFVNRILGSFCKSNIVIQWFHAHAGGALMVLISTGVLLFLLVKYQDFQQKRFRSTGDHANILLIVLDTARSDRFSCYGYRRDTTPFLSSFCENAHMYREAISPAPWTMPAHASIFTGFYPAIHGTTWKNLSLNEGFHTLSEFLAGKGYTTVGLSNNPWLNMKNGMVQGFETFVEMWKLDMRNPTLYTKIEWFILRFFGLNDGGAYRTNQWVLQWFKNIYQRDRPFFLFINYMECHLRFDAPDSYHYKFAREQFSPVVKKLSGTGEMLSILNGDLKLTGEEWRDFGDIYDGDLFYIDKKLEELFHYLKTTSYLENTIVIITSDHGEHLGEHSLIDHQLSLYEPLLMVPLIIKTPQKLPPLPEIMGPVQTIDIYPTLVDLSGFRDDLGGFQFHGLSLLGKDALSRDYTLSEYDIPVDMLNDFLNKHPDSTAILKYNREIKAIRKNSVKYVWSSKGGSELYDLAEDPGELINLKEIKPEEADIMDSRLEELLDSLQKFKPVDDGQTKRQLDDETIQSLKDLGYIQ